MNWCRAAVAVVFVLTVSVGAGSSRSDSTATSFQPELSKSVYAPAKTRDPLMRLGGPIEVATNKSVSAIVAPTSFTFRLEGILYHPTAPAAIINDHFVELNKLVKLPAGTAQVQVKAVEITRDRVTLEAAGQRFELRLATKPGDGKSLP